MFGLVGWSIHLEYVSQILPGVRWILPLLMNAPGGVAQVAGGKMAQAGGGEMFGIIGIVSEIDCGITQV